ncbi:hypothetical protein [Paracoccus liaowanqingii]|nr:hypothetical protein [Paracoccus liaowanqingii]
MTVIVVQSTQDRQKAPGCNFGKLKASPLDCKRENSTNAAPFILEGAAL